MAVITKDEGISRANINLVSGEVTALSFAKSYEYYAVRNDGANDFYISTEDSACTPNGDNVVCVKASDSYVHHNGLGKEGIVYFSGNGAVTVIGQDTGENPFKTSWKGGVDRTLSKAGYAADAKATGDNIADIKDNISFLGARVDNIAKLPEGSTTADAELADIRVGVDGNKYPNAGTAVRTQVSELKEDLSELESSVLKTVNLINVDELLENKYYDLTTGVLTTGNGTTMCTPLIQVTSGTYYLYTNTSGSQIFGVGIFDANKNFVRNIPPYDFTVIPKITIVDNEKYIGITMYNEKVNNTALVASRYRGYFKAVGNTKNFIPPHKMLDFSKGNNVLVVDAKGNGDFTTINSALSSITDDSADNPYTILIYPSVYKEVVAIQGGRHISLIGVNMKDCIIRDDTGLYENSPLQIQGDCLIENLTIIATHDENADMPHTGNKAYAIHIDYEGEGITTVRNCRLISYQSSAIGAGLHQDQTLLIENCELTSYTPNSSVWDDTSDWTATPSYGALFVHSATDSNVTNQKLIVKDCILTSANKRVCAFSNSPDGTSNMEIDLINNNFWCADGNADSTVTEWYNPVYSGRSFGNNIAKLNAN